MPGAEGGHDQALPPPWPGRQQPGAPEAGEVLAPQEGQYSSGRLLAGRMQKHLLHQRSDCEQKRGMAAQPGKRS